MIDLYISNGLLALSLIISFWDKLKKRKDDPVGYKKNNVAALLTFILGLSGLLYSYNSGRTNLFKTKASEQNAIKKESLNKVLNDSLHKTQRRIELLLTQENNKSNRIIDSLSAQKTKMEIITDENRNISKQLSRSYKAQLDYISSPDSYCYILPEFTRRMRSVDFYLRHEGKYPVKDIRIIIQDIGRRHMSPHHPRTLKNLIIETTKTYNYSEVYTNLLEPIQNSLVFDMQTNYEFLITINGNSGLIEESIKYDSLTGGIMVVKRGKKILLKKTADKFN